MYQNDPLKVLTGEVRLSHVSVLTPKIPEQGGEAKYSVTLLIPKTDAATKADIDASMQAAMQAAHSSSWGGAYPPMLGTPKFQGYEYPKNGLPIYDGDGVRFSGEPFSDECKGHWVIAASSKNKPQVVGMDNINVELSPSDIYSGMYGRVTIRFFGYANSGNKGIGCGLGNIMKTRDGEALSGSASAASDFATVGNAVVQPLGGIQGQIPPPPPGYVPAAPAFPPPGQPVYPPAPQGYAPAVTINPLTGLPL